MTVTMIVTDQKISETMPKMWSRRRLDRVRVAWIEDGLDRVERARADVAEDDAERSERARPALLSASSQGYLDLDGYSVSREATRLDALARGRRLGGSRDGRGRGAEPGRTVRVRGVTGRDRLVNGLAEPGQAGMRTGDPRMPP